MGIDSSSSPISRLELTQKSLVIAGLYVLAGTAALQLPYTSGYISSIWPASGVAVALLLAWGWRCWPGVWLGSLLINLWINPSLQGAGIGILLAAANTLQTLLIASLVQRFRGNWTVTGGRGLAVCLLAAGPLSCTISASLSCAVLLFTGKIASDNLFSEWLLWWSGDTLGVLLFTPLSRLLWSGAYSLRITGVGIYRLALPLLITAILLVICHLGLSQLEELRARSEARKLMELIGDSGTRELTETISPLVGLAHFIAASQETTREAFHYYSRSFINRPAILSVDWAPRITPRERSAFEAAAVREGFPAFRISDLDSDGRLRPAGDRDEYFPVLFSEPLPQSYKVLGLDHAFELPRRAAMSIARDYGQAIASDRIRLARTDRQASLVFIPVHHLNHGAPAQQLTGFVVGVLDIEELFSPLLNMARERQFAMLISDVTPGNPRRHLVGSLPPGTHTDWSYDFHIGGRTWRLEMEPEIPLWRPGWTTEEHLFIAFSILTAFLVVFATLSSAERHGLVSRQVAEQTSQLQLAASQLGTLNSELQQRIEERSQALDDLNTKKQEIRAILDHLLECVITIDRRGIVQSVNPAIEPLLGYRPEELLGRNVYCLMAPSQRDEYADYLKHYLRTSGRRIIGSSRGIIARHKDGHTVDLELSVSGYSVHGERFFIGTLRDIREQKALIASLTQAREDAEQGSRAKSAFLATMSHEIRTPMNGVIGLADVLVRDRLLPHQADLVRTIRDSAHDLLDVIDDILDFSKIEAGKLELEHLPLPFTELIDNLCRTLKPLASSRDVELERDIAADIPLWVCSDATRLRQILYNLIGNAIKFSGWRSDCPGRVMVRARLTDADPLRVTITVEDNGIGIAPEQLARLFEPFTQAESSTTRRFGGSGLGLAICKRLVNLLGGELAVDSTPGKGSIFTVTLPLTATSASEVSDDTPELATGESSISMGNAASRRILVVEDDVVNLKVIQQQLTLLGYRFEIAIHGIEALTMWRAGNYDLILSDLHMPEMDGYQLAKCIRHEEEGTGHRIPILALTANALRDEASRGRAAGLDGYLTKPILLVDLEAALAHWLSSTAPVCARPDGPLNNDLSLIDTAALIALVGEDRTIIREILGDYIDALSSLAPKMREAFEHNDIDTIGALAHRLKSSSRAVGAVSLGQLCDALEQATNKSDLSALRRHMIAFTPLHSATEARIGQLLKNDYPA